MSLKNEKYIKKTCAILKKNVNFATRTMELHKGHQK